MDPENESVFSGNRRSDFRLLLLLVSNERDYRIVRLLPYGWPVWKPLRRTQNFGRSRTELLTIADLVLD